MNPPSPSSASRASIWSQQGWLGSRIHLLSFQARATGLRLARGIRNAFEATGSRREISLRTEKWPVVLGESRSPLWHYPDPSDWKLTTGKVENLRRAADLLNGTVLDPSEIFSFWQGVGQPTRRRGFVEGRELREGCLIASVGGGLCQLSNALYAVALETGQEIVERHAHSRVVPGSQAALGQDATVFWNYIDLRFRATVALRLEVEITSSHLIVRLRAAKSVARREPLPLPRMSPALKSLSPEPGDCGECRHRDCIHRR